MIPAFYNRSTLQSLRRAGRTLAPLVLVVTTINYATAAEFIPLGTLRGYQESLAYGTSDDGTVVAGNARIGSSHQAFRWTEATGMIGLGYLPGDNDSYAGQPGWQPVSGDGSTIVGGSGRFDREGFIYTVSAGMSDLGGISGSAYGVSHDGRVVIGDIGGGAS